MSGAPLTKLFTPSTKALSEALDPIGALPGVTDYLLINARGVPVARTTHYGYDDQQLGMATEALRRSSIVLRAYLGADAPECEPLALRFSNGWLLAWRLGGATLVVFGREGLDLPTIRMRVSILHRELGDSRRLKRFLAGGPDGGLDWARATAQSDEERCWIDAIAGGRTDG
jgi:predicted regulator of Ras-like GTPase activity (Roadblock/LC7/MglB family)